MTDQPQSAPLLDPIDRLSEIMFGLLMALTFTGTARVQLGDGATVNSIMLAALGCNFAWGLIDGVMYLMTSAVARQKHRREVQAIVSAPDEQACAQLRGLMPGGAGGLIGDAQAMNIVHWLRNHEPAKPESAVTLDDVKAAVAVLCLTVLATLPPILPFLLTSNVTLAMRLSNLVAVLMLFWIGWRFDKLTGGRSMVMRFAVPVVSVLLVAITIALGG